MALALGVELPSLQFGYRDAAEFVAQVNGFVAWYAVPRSSPAHATVLARLVSLASGLSVGVVDATGAGVPVAASDEEPAGKDIGDRAAVAGGGITDSEAIQDALRTVQNPVVLQGLLNNQLVPAGIPKGTLRMTWRHAL